MSSDRAPTPKYRFVFLRSSLFLKCLLVAVLLICLVVLLLLRSLNLQEDAQERQLRAQAAALEQENEEYRENIDQLGTLEGAIKIAMEQLGLVDPDTEFFTPSN